MSVNRSLAILVLFAGVVALVMGAVFIGLGVARNSELKEAMRVEHVALGIETAPTLKHSDVATGVRLAPGAVIDHRRIAPIGIRIGREPAVVARKTPDHARVRQIEFARRAIATAVAGDTTALEDGSDVTQKLDVGQRLVVDGEIDLATLILGQEGCLF